MEINIPSQDLQEFGLNVSRLGGYIVRKDCLILPDYYTDCQSMHEWNTTYHIQYHRLTMFADLPGNQAHREWAIPGLETSMKWHLKIHKHMENILCFLF